MAGIHQINGHWYIDYSIKNNRVRKSCKTKDKNIAMQMKKAIESKLASAHILQLLKQEGVSHISKKDRKVEIDWILSRWNCLNSRERQAIVFVLYKGKCVYCNTEVRLPTYREKFSPDRATLDHKIPHVAGGSDSFDNIILACNKCNQMKADKDEDKFLEEIAIRNIKKTGEEFSQILTSRSLPDQDSSSINVNTIQ